MTLDNDKPNLEGSYNAHLTGSVPNAQEEFKMRRMTLIFGARNAKFSNTDQL